MKILGKHLVVELTGCNRDMLNDCDRLFQKKTPFSGGEGRFFLTIFQSGAYFRVRR